MDSLSQNRSKSRRRDTNIPELTTWLKPEDMNAAAESSSYITPGHCASRNPLILEALAEIDGKTINDVEKEVCCFVVGDQRFGDCMMVIVWPYVKDGFCTCKAACNTATAHDVPAPTLVYLPRPCALTDDMLGLEVVRGSFVLKRFKNVGPNCGQVSRESMVRSTILALIQVTTNQIDEMDDVVPVKYKHVTLTYKKTVLYRELERYGGRPSGQQQHVASEMRKMGLIENSPKNAVTVFMVNLRRIRSAIYADEATKLLGTIRSDAAVTAIAAAPAAAPTLLVKLPFNITLMVKSEGEDYSYRLLISRKRPSTPARDNSTATEEELPLRSFLSSCGDLEKLQVLGLVNTMRPHLPGVEQLAEHTDDAPLPDFEKFVSKTMLTMISLGIRLAVPKELKKILKPRIVLKSKGSSAARNVGGQSLLTTEAMLEYEWQVAMGGDHVVDMEAFKELVSKSKRSLKFKDSYVMLEEDEVKQLIAASEKPPCPLTQFELLAAVLDEANSPYWLDAATRAELKQLITPKEIELPSGIQATLREYQTRGFQWMMTLMTNGFGCVLADDMGLGKTLQIIVVLATLKQRGMLDGTNGRTALVVVPTSLLYNWQREINKFAPGLLTTRLHYGVNRNVADNDTGSGKKQRTHDADVVLSSYGTVRSSYVRSNDGFFSKKFEVVIIDEAQAIKNGASERSMAVKALNARVRVALSGTPVENRLADLHSIFDFVLPKYLGTLEQFNTDFGKPIEVDKNTETRESLRRVTAPFIMRRLKTNETVISDLPPKVVNNLYVALKPEQAALYQSVTDDALAQLELSKTDPELKKKRGGLVFQLITRLKQVCNHPHTFNQEQPEDPGLSGKCMALFDLIEPILDEGEKVIIFTQYVTMQKTLVKVISERFHTVPLLYNGEMNQEQRDGAVTAFTNASFSKVFVISLKAGGVGLNLTAANHVVHFDLWFNPAVENQATDRAFRIGQVKTVFVHRLICNGTIEEKIQAMIESKKELSDMSVEAGETWLTKLGDEQLAELFTIRG